jgi:hypothetical protein
MPDIVDRLREAKACTQKTFLHSPDWAEGRKLLDEAISEIEQLRTKVAIPTPPGPLSKGADFAAWWTRGFPKDQTMRLCVKLNPKPEDMK